MGFLFPQSPPPAPAKDDTDIQEEALRERRRRLLARGRASTRLTGGQGVAGAAPTLRKTLLGE